jgi:hypothetical protein
MRVQRPQSAWWDQHTRTSLAHCAQNSYESISAYCPEAVEGSPTSGHDPRVQNSGAQQRVKDRNTVTVITRPPGWSVGQLVVRAEPPLKGDRSCNALKTSGKRTPGTSHYMHARSSSIIGCSTSLQRAATKSQPPA